MDILYEDSAFLYQGAELPEHLKERTAQRVQEYKEYEKECEDAWVSFSARKRVWCCFGTIEAKNEEEFYRILKEDHKQDINVTAALIAPLLGKKNL